MKKTFMLLLAVAALTIVSCKKDYTCTCTTTYASGGTPDKDVTVLKGVTKKQAGAYCADTETKDESTGTVVATSDCELSK